MLVRNFIQHGISMSLNFFANVGCLLYLAFVWDVPDFGRFSFWWSISVLLALIVDYGSILRVQVTHGEESSDATRCATVLITKAMLQSVWLLGVLPLGLMGYGLTGRQDWLLLLFLGLASQMQSSFDFFAAVARVNTGYREECQHAFLMYGLFVLACVGLSRFGVVGVAVGIFGVKMLSTLHFYSVCRARGWLVFAAGNFRERWADFRQSAYFGFDSFVTTLVANGDVILARLMFGEAAAGVFALGSRLVQAMTMAAVIIANVFLPRMGRKGWKNDLKKMVLLLLAAGAFGSLVFVAVGFSNLEIFTQKFEALQRLSFVFAVIVLIRFVGACAGIILVGRGRIKQKLLGNILGTVFFPVLGFILGHRLGLFGVALASIVSILISTGMYYVFLITAVLPRKCSG